MALASGRVGSLGRAMPCVVVRRFERGAFVPAAARPMAHRQPVRGPGQRSGVDRIRVAIHVTPRRSMQGRPSHAAALGMLGAGRERSGLDRSKPGRVLFSTLAADRHVAAQHGGSPGTVGAARGRRSGGCAANGASQQGGGDLQTAEKLVSPLRGDCRSKAKWAPACAGATAIRVGAATSWRAPAPAARRRGSLPAAAPCRRRPGNSAARGHARPWPGRGCHG